VNYCKKSTAENQEMRSSSLRRRSALGNDVSVNADGEAKEFCAADAFIASSETPPSRTWRPHSRPRISEYMWLVIFSVFGAILLLVHTAFNSYPPAVTVQSAKDGQFVEERARQTLIELTAIGPRPVGSRANEERTVNYLLSTIREIQTEMNVEQHLLEVDSRRVGGTFAIDFLGQFTSRYDNVNNVVAKLCPKRGGHDSLLVNCHYDTVVNSTGICARVLLLWKCLEYGNPFCSSRISDIAVHLPEL